MLHTRLAVEGTGKFSGCLLAGRVAMSDSDLARETGLRLAKFRTILDSLILRGLVEICEIGGVVCYRISQFKNEQRRVAEQMRRMCDQPIVDSVEVKGSQESHLKRSVYGGSNSESFLNGGKRVDNSALPVDKSVAAVENGAKTRKAPVENSKAAVNSLQSQTVEKEGDTVEPRAYARERYVNVNTTTKRHAPSGASAASSAVAGAHCSSPDALAVPGHNGTEHGSPGLAASTGDRQRAMSAFFQRYTDGDWSKDEFLSAVAALSGHNGTERSSSGSAREQCAPATAEEAAEAPEGAWNERAALQAIERLTADYKSRPAWRRVLAALGGTAAGRQALRDGYHELRRLIEAGGIRTSRAQCLMGLYRAKCEDLGIVWPFREGRDS